ncbi:MAG TPA: hypothetical protein VMG12_30175 [Polyangiaceae bacterium]|nr:hypothetical protein [Polyangiaceae bacterium]
MTEIDDLELSQRLRALRVDPPPTGFEARLAERLRAETPEPAPPPRSARVIRGPWLRRGPVRLIGATALFVAGAAAAVEGGVVEWVQARVQAVRSAEPPAPNLPERPTPAPRRERIVPERAEPSLEPPAAPPALELPRAAELPPVPAPETGPNVPRLAPAYRNERPREAAAPERRPALEHPIVPRLEIDLHGAEQRSDPDTRLGRGLGKPGQSSFARERRPDLERIRDIAKARRERVESNERPRLPDRVRERREPIDVERREMQERVRRDRSPR